MAVAVSGSLNQSYCSAAGVSEKAKSGAVTEEKKQTATKTSDKSKTPAGETKDRSRSAMIADPSSKRDSAKVSKPCQSALDKTHALFSAELKKYVSNGSVNYALWKKNPKPLLDYLSALSKVSKDDYERLSQDEKLVYWINAYNAFTIKLVLDNYPIKGTKTYYPVSSIRQLDGFWEDNKIDLAGRKVTLESMEHDILRRDFLEPRTHFAVVCAARGCAGIKDSAFTTANINDQLDRAAAGFLSNPKNVRFDLDKNMIYVSQLFKWFPLDFASVVGLGKRFPPPTDDEIVAAYVISKAPEAVQKKFSSQDPKKIKVIYEEYDWTLNDSALPVEK